MPKETRAVFRLLPLVLAVGLVVPNLGVVAQERAQLGKNGVADPSAGSLPRPRLGAIPPSETYLGANYQAGGTGMRNQRLGGISINGVTAPPIAAWLYWAFITEGPPTPALHASMRIRRLFPGPASANVMVMGVVFGAGVGPCPWPGDTLTVYRAPVPLAVATGNGFYQVSTISSESTSSVAGEDPGFLIPSPLLEGASLVIVYPGTGTTEIFDLGLSGTPYAGDPGLFYTLGLSAPAVAGYFKWDNITADGQKFFPIGPGGSRLALAPASDEVTILEGLLIAGPGSPANDSDQNGNDSTPSPSLWDTRGHFLFDPGVGEDGFVDVAIFSPTGEIEDCLSAVANIVNY